LQDGLNGHELPPVPAAWRASGVRLVARAAQHWQRRIFSIRRIHGRQFAQIEYGSAVGFDASGVHAICAQSGAYSLLLCFVLHSHVTRIALQATASRDGRDVTAVRRFLLWTSRQMRNILACTFKLKGDLMKPLTAKLALYTLLTLTIGAFAASAQISTQIVFRMSRPFVVGNTTFPEGNFVIREVPGAAKLTLEFSNPRGGASTKVETQSIPPDPTIHAAEIAFNKYANLMALSQVFPGPGKHGYQLVPGQAERDAAKTEKPLRQTIPAHGS
jgi:hypothetical protein